MVYVSKKKSSELTKMSYLGMVNNSSKHFKSGKFGTMVYTIYLSPAKMSGYEVCPMRNVECTELCLNESGHNRMSSESNRINLSRIKKTKLFFENRDFFVNWMVDEIASAKRSAERKNMEFAVRLNNTSDLNPEMFQTKINGKWVNVLEMFSDVQFYDYTKVPNRIKLMEKYPNYDVTFSYDGYNLDTCLTMLEKNVRVAMVFNKVPKTYMGIEVVDGDKNDLRYLDGKNVIVGLKFKKVRNKLNKNHKFVIQN